MQEGIDPFLPKRRLERLAAFLPTFEGADFNVGEVVGGGPDRRGMIMMPFIDYHPAVLDFQRVAYEEGWVLTDFDWPAWRVTDEASRLMAAAGAIEEAGPEQLAKLLTVLIRQERFSEGSLAEAFHRGVIVRIVRRAAALAATDASGHG